jgi:hypothetical protein
MNQKQLLEKPKTRKVLQRVKADSASLFVHRDTASFKSKMTDNLSKMSLIFEFDSEVFYSQVYHRVFRGSLKTRLRQQQLQLHNSEPVIDPPDDTEPKTTRDKDSGVIQELTPDTPTYILADRDDLTIVKASQARMLSDCVDFTIHLQRRSLQPASLYNLTKSIGPTGELTEATTREAVALWKLPAFEQLLYDNCVRDSTMSMTGVPTSLISPDTMTLCKL